MKSVPKTDPRSVPSATARAEAAAWVARLHGPNRTPEVEAGLRKWLSEDAERAAAFELMTDTWEKSTQLRRRPSERLASLERPGFRLSFSRAMLATLVIACIAAIGTAFYLHTEGVTTEIGELRALTLEDGTRVHLNTNSHVVVRYDKYERRIELDTGEALFEVAQRPNWPFIVTAGDRQVQALGTAFIVRRDSTQLAVTLVEGKVAVLPAAGIPAPASTTAAPSSVANSSHPSHRRPPNTTGSYTLAPGERLTFVAQRPPKLDQPSIERVTAWQRSQVILDDTPLDEAIMEMNRYNTTPLRIAAAVGRKDIRVSGIFRAGDSDNFAQAVARTYALTVTRGSDEILLSAAPAQR